MVNLPFSSQQFFKFYHRVIHIIPLAPGVDYTINLAENLILKFEGIIEKFPMSR